MNNEELPRIGDVRMYCFVCGWQGKVNDCEPDVDGDGSLGCPECLSVALDEFAERKNLPGYLGNINPLGAEPDVP